MKQQSPPLRMVTLNGKRRVFACISEVDLNDPKYSKMLHWHDCFEMELVLSGSAIHHLNNRTYRIHPGSMYFLSPNDLHTLLPDPEALPEPLRILNICIDDFLISSTPASGVATPLTAELNPTQFSFFRALSDELIYEKKHTGDYWSEIQQHLIVAAFLKLAQIADPPMQNGSRSEESNPVAQGGLNYIHKAIAYIRYNFKDPTLTTQRIADAIPLSHNYFGMLFKRHTGRSCLSYLNDVRMKFASSLLIHSDLSVNEIAEQCGYVGTPYFISNFRACNGLPPQKFRETRRAEQTSDSFAASGSTDEKNNEKM